MISCSFLWFEYLYLDFYPILKWTVLDGCQQPFAGKSCTDLPFKSHVNGLLMSHEIICGAVSILNAIGTVLVCSTLALFASLTHICRLPLFPVRTADICQIWVSRASICTRHAWLHTRQRTVSNLLPRVSINSHFLLLGTGDRWLVQRRR